MNSLYKKELIEREGPWRRTDDVMLATLEWVDWYDTERLHSACGYIPPKEHEENYYAQRKSAVGESRPANESLQKKPGRSNQGSRAERLIDFSSSTRDHPCPTAHQASYRQ
jgi:hypothetical protein